MIIDNDNYHRIGGGNDLFDRPGYILYEDDKIGWTYNKIIKNNFSITVVLTRLEDSMSFCY